MMADSSSDKTMSPAEEETQIGWKMAGLGFETASEVAAGVLLGWIWDTWRGTAPTGAMVGGIIGIAVGTYTLIRGTLKLNRRLTVIEKARLEQRRKDSEARRLDELAGRDAEAAEDTATDSQDEWSDRWNEDPLFSDEWSDEDDFDSESTSRDH